MEELRANFLMPFCSWFHKIVLLPALDELPAFRNENEAIMQEIWTNILRWAMLGRLEDVALYFQANLKLIAASIASTNLLSIKSEVEASLQNLIVVLYSCPRLQQDADFSDDAMVSWQSLLQNCLDLSLSSHLEIRCLGDILAASGSVQFNAQVRVAGHWSHLFISQILYTSSITSKEVATNPSKSIIDCFEDASKLLSKCINWWTSIEEFEPSPFEKCAISIITGDCTKAINVVDSLVAVPMITAHLVDLLAEVMLPNTFVDGLSLREYHLLEYAHSIALDDLLWENSLDYYQKCGEAGAAGIITVIEYQSNKLALESFYEQAVALKLLNICDAYHLGDQKIAILNVLSQRALNGFKFAVIANHAEICDNIPQLTEAFFWLSAARKFDIISSISLQLLHMYIKKQITINVLGQVIPPMVQFHSISYEFDFLAAFYLFELQSLELVSGIQDESSYDLSGIINFIRNDAVPLPFRLPLVTEIVELLSWGQKNKLAIENFLTTDNALLLVRFFELSATHYDRDSVLIHCSQDKITATRLCLVDMMKVLLVSK